jgi:hypothetical protein
MKTNYPLFLFAVLGWEFLVFSCTGFFSTSLAPWAARSADSLIPPVTVGNVGELITQSEKSPDMSLALLQKIQDAVDGADAEDASTLQAAALQTAANASSLGPVLLEQVSNISEILDDPAGIENMVAQAINSLTHLEETSEALTAALPDPADSGAFDAFVAKADPDDLAAAAAVLFAAEAKDGDADFFTDFDPSSPGSASAELAVKLAEEAIAKYDAAGSPDHPLKSFLDSLMNLSPPGP